MKWNNLKINKCPVCGRKGLRGSAESGRIICGDMGECPFTISYKKFSEIVNEKVERKNEK